MRSCNSWLRPYDTVNLDALLYRELQLTCDFHSFWEALSGICSRTIQHSDSQVNRLCISPDKRFLAAAGHHTVKLYDIKSSNPNPLLSFEGHTGNITGVAFHCEGKWMVTSSEDGTVKIWETRSGTVQRSYSHGCAVNDVVIHPNQGEIISCDRGGSVRIWDLAENNCSHQLIPEEDCPVASVTVASDGSTLCAGTNTVGFDLRILYGIAKLRLA
jgi:G protein beta subunit-like protein